MPAFDSQQVQPLITKLQAESERACAVLAGATLDAILEDLLKAAIRSDSPKELFSGSGAVATVSAKIDVAYSFGLIGSIERSDLHLIRKIRNEFAHAVTHELSFATSTVADRVRSLSIPKMFEGDQILSSANDTIRWRFEVGTGFLIESILRFRLPNLIRATAPKELSKAPPKA